MTILILMCAGAAVGLWLFPARWQKGNAKVQAGLTAVLIFCMGISLGARPGFFEELASLGLKSLVLCGASILGSVALVYPLTQRFLVKRPGKGREEKK